jgi:hypothetical protein
MVAMYLPSCGYIHEYELQDRHEYHQRNFEKYILTKYILMGLLEIRIGIWDLISTMDLV